MRSRQQPCAPLATRRMSSHQPRRQLPTQRRHGIRSSGDAHVPHKATSLAAPTQHQRQRSPKRPPLSTTRSSIEKSGRRCSPFTSPSVTRGTKRTRSTPACAARDTRRCHHTAAAARFIQILLARWRNQRVIPTASGVRSAVMCNGNPSLKGGVVVASEPARTATEHPPLKSRRFESRPSKNESIFA